MIKNKFVLGTMLVGVAGLFTACSDDNDSNPVLTQPTEFVLNNHIYGNSTVDLTRTETIELNWSQPKFTQENAPINAVYEIQVSPTNSFTVSAAEAEADKDAELVADYAAVDKTSTTCKVELSAADLDKALIKVTKWEDGAVPATQKAYIRIYAFVAEGDARLYPIASNVLELNVAPYYMELRDADPNWWHLIGGDIGDGQWGDDVPASLFPMQPQKNYEFDKTTGDGELVWTGYIAGNGFKLKHVPNSWDDQWGGSIENPVENDGGSSDFKATAGFYTITLNTGTHDLVIKPYTGDIPYKGQVYITGSFNGWAADKPMTAAHVNAGANNHDWCIELTFDAGAEIKFYDGADWAWNIGGSLIPLSDGAYGYGEVNGSNIIIEEAGTYTVIMNDITGYYRFIKK